jgi:hypothetical protein
MRVTDKGYIRQIPLALDLKQLTTSCAKANKELKNMFSVEDMTSFKAVYEAGTGPFTTGLLTAYNLLCFPYPGFHELYQAIRNEFRKVIGNNDPYYIGTWVNYYDDVDYLNWHNHGPAKLEGWHGYFCVNGEGSVTTYRMPWNKEEEVDIHNKNNTLILSVTGGDEHIARPWKSDTGPKITIAYDIMPQKSVSPSYTNFWIPI